MDKFNLYVQRYCSILFKKKITSQSNLLKKKTPVYNNLDGPGLNTNGPFCTSISLVQGNKYK